MLNYTPIHALLLNVYRHKIIWNYPQKQGKLSCNERGKTNSPSKLLFRIYLKFSSFRPEPFPCGSFTTHIALKTKVQKASMQLMEFKLFSI